MFTQKLAEIFNSGDSEVRTWLLIQQSYMPFIMCGFYSFFSTVVGPAIMKNRNAFNLRKAMVVFNFFIVAVYVITLSIIFWNLQHLRWEEFCKAGTVKKGDITYTIIRSFWVIYILKYVEFFDTVFFVLRKKENLITFLHVLHHTITPIFGWIIFRTEKSGFQFIPVLINSCVHVVMYTYYGLAAMGPNYKKHLWWKKYLTQFQIIQFFLIILFVTVITPFSGCTLGHASYWMNFILGLLFLYLFYRFYVITFRYKKYTIRDGKEKKLR